MKFCKIIFLLLISSSLIFAQDWIDPNRGAEKYRKTITMQANNVQSMFGNWENVGQSTQPYAGIWPKGTLHSHIQEMTFLAAGQVTGSDGNTYHVVSESYSENPNLAPDGHGYWWNPLPGYANENRRALLPDGSIDSASQVAHSADPTTWPSSWPGWDASLNGKWNGYSGADQLLADDEAYYVTDDASNNKYPYYPFPEDTARRGLGLQCETRLFQWSNSMVNNDIFIHYRVKNISSVNYSKNIFIGFYADVCPGGYGSTNDVDSYDIDYNLIVAYAYQNKGIWTDHTDILPGYMAYKLLESPGDPDDGIDNDHDGLVDERQDNDAGSYIYGPIGNYGSACLHWSGDENGNWDPNTDDVGSDGIGPYDDNYPGPDADGTEGNGRPDQGEPDFGFRDKDESDQVGLTSFTAPVYGSVLAKNEDQIWAQIQPGTFVNPTPNANLLWIFASGPVSLSSHSTIPYSTCWLFAPDQTTIFRNALTAQNFYNYNYYVSGLIQKFYAVPDTVELGDTAVIHWRTTKGSTVQLNGANVKIADSLKVQPSQNVKYTLITSGFVSNTREITVVYNPPGVIKSFTVDNPVIELGVSDSSNLKWSVTKGSTVTLNGVGAGITGSEKILPQITTLYTLIVKGADNIDTSIITVQALPTDKINRALKQKISSSLSLGNYSADLAVDGDTTSYWQSQPGTLQWITVDLSKVITVKRIVLNWGTSYAAAYQIQAIGESADTTLIYSNNDNKGGVNDLSGFNTNCRYVRIAVLSDNYSAIGCRLNEFQVYGSLITGNAEDNSNDNMPKTFTLEQNYPNPFNPTTSIEYQIPCTCHVCLIVYDMLGREVSTLVNAEQSAGNHEVIFDGSKLSSGVYFIRMQAGNFMSTKKMMMVK